MKKDSFKKGISNEQLAKLGVLNFGYKDASPKRALITQAFASHDVTIRNKAFDFYKEKEAIDWACDKSIASNIVLFELKSIRAKGARHGFSVTQFERENQVTLKDQFKFIIWYVKYNQIQEVTLSDLESCASDKYVVWNMFFNHVIAAGDNDE